jgi:hypothetical protein
VDPDKLRSVIIWSNAYRSEWDQTPDAYLEHEKVGWGRSRRLGLYRVGDIKAYIGVQHIDPDKPGWGFIGRPECRFFLSLFVRSKCVTLRSFPSVSDALDYLTEFLHIARK